MKKLFLLVLFVASINVAFAKNYGTDMPKGKAVDIAAAIANIENFSGKPGKFKGRITQVCQAKGCWLMVESDGKAARIKTNDKFFVPKDSKGKVVVFGEIKQVELKPEMAKHLAEDAGKAEPVASSEVHILATSITIK
jgi:Domain of unknown function (DUF4920)